MNAKDYAAITLILAMAAASTYTYGRLPEKIAIHWNAAGEIDGYGTRTWAFFPPVLTAAVYAFLLLIPKIEVFKENMASFSGYYDNIKLLIVAFMAVLHAATLLENTIGGVPIALAIILPLSALIYYIGHAMPHMKRNFFVGIRTPWTLANDAVWEKTHDIGGKTFRLNAIVILLSTLASQQAILVLIISLIANALFLTAYSYWLYQKTKNNQLK